MNFTSPVTALFPGASGRTVAALSAHLEALTAQAGATPVETGTSLADGAVDPNDSDGSDGPDGAGTTDSTGTADGAALSVEELARLASVAATQLESVLFRLGLLGMIVARRRGDDVRVVPGHIAWGAVGQLADLRGRLVDDVRRRVDETLTPAPVYLALTGKVADGTAAHPADLLEIVVVPPYGEGSATLTTASTASTASATPAAPAADEWRARLARLADELSRDLGNLVQVHEMADADTARSHAGPAATVLIEPR